MKTELWYSAVVRDQKGKVISRERRKSRSIVRGWADMLYVLLANVSWAIKLTNGTSPLVYSTDASNLRMTAAIAEDDRSLVVGSGDTAVTISDYAMETKIAEGAGAGQLNHQATTVNASIVAAPHCGFIIERAFTNNSGGDVTVREAGIHVSARLAAGTGYVLAIRDVLGVAQVIPNGGSLSINYTLRVTV